ncbi:hypothetical protein AV521_26400 [Streptomyces sp. IMTB 2501]|nr:hypothetical protein AV521_26400 [Streptomyces sp. IMTB 2501]
MSTHMPSMALGFTRLLITGTFDRARILLDPVKRAGNPRVQYAPLTSAIDFGSPGASAKYLAMCAAKALGGSWP